VAIKELMKVIRANVSCLVSCLKYTDVAFLYTYP